MVKKSEVVVGVDDIIGTINPNIYGYFTEPLVAGPREGLIYPGIWVGEDSTIPNVNGIRKDLIEVLKKINPPVIRWPGGCFADGYCWEDGIGPRDERRRRLSFWFLEESNHFGTDEFLNFCSLVGAEPYICLNVGTGNPREARSWVEYCNYGGKSYYADLRARNGHPKPYYVKYWGVGNENWGCGGCFSSHEYGLEYRKFANCIKGFALRPPENWQDVELVACGHSGGLYSQEWNLELMRTLKDYLYLVDYISIHYYSHGCGEFVNFSDEEYYKLLANVLELEHQIQQTIEIADFFAKGRKDIGIVVDEWGAMHRLKNVSEYQVTLRDAIFVASVLNLFNRYSKKVVMANISTLVNVLQALFLTEGSKIVGTPVYHVFDMYKGHMGKLALKVNTSSHMVKEAPPVPELGFRFPLPKPQSLPALDVSASISKNHKELVTTIVNLSLDDDIEMKIRLDGKSKMRDGTMTRLTGANVRSFNDFCLAERVGPVTERVKAKGKALSLEIPPHSVNALLLELE